MVYIFYLFLKMLFWVKDDPGLIPLLVWTLNPVEGVADPIFICADNLWAIWDVEALFFETLFESRCLLEPTCFFWFIAILAVGGKNGSGVLELNVELNESFDITLWLEWEVGVLRPCEPFLILCRLFLTIDFIGELFKILVDSAILPFVISNDWFEWVGAWFLLDPDGTTLWLELCLIWLTKDLVTTFLWSIPGKPSIESFAVRSIVSGRGGRRSSDLLFVLDFKR